ncbi:hypothetical protein B296_00056611 [Ensete ventricosum]|uniref:Uncharacterized protein n=1 Tax=Ensete ventricosum TaxID=4639 RepID=A0A426WVE4_ENSVE|nr:hypothetical protein B296_00056611 [Ensete ventricosum]
MAYEGSEEEGQSGMARPSAKGAGRGGLATCKGPTRGGVTRGHGRLRPTHRGDGVDRKDGRPLAGRLSSAKGSRRLRKATMATATQMGKRG